MSAQRYGTPDVEKGSEESLLIIYMGTIVFLKEGEGERGEKGEREGEGRKEKGRWRGSSNSTSSQSADGSLRSPSQPQLLILSQSTVHCHQNVLWRTNLDRLHLLLGLCGNPMSR